MRPRDIDGALATTSGTARTKDETHGGLAIPILLVVFNRPETTQAVIESIRTIRPSRLFVAADGARRGVAGEAARCMEARRIATKIDWPCTVRTFFRDENAGAAINVSEAITWFFSDVEAGIILEDDCVPGESFYLFCRDLLAYYQDDDRIMHISGNNFQYGRMRGTASYYFSSYPLVWGWASWRRAWRLYDFNLRPEWELQDAWDTQWLLSIQKNGGMAITPQANLVTNVGFGPGASHTRTVERYTNLPSAEISFPLAHPAVMKIDTRADEFTYYSHFRNVAHLRFIWFYRTWDRIYLALKRAKRFIRRIIAP